MLEVEDVVAAAHSDQDQASTHGSDTDDEDDVAEDDDDDDFSSEEDTDDDDHHDPPSTWPNARTKLHHVAKTLRATAKKSKTFEVQKLVKKLKGLRKKDTLADQAKPAEQELAQLSSRSTQACLPAALCYQDGQS